MGYVQSDSSDPNKLVLVAEENYSEFLKKVNHRDVDYEEAIKTIFHLEPVDYWGFGGSVPQIKLPGLPWFKVMADRKKIASLGSILAKTRSPEKPLDCKKFFGKDVECLLLYTTNVPFELVIDYPLQSIVSLVPGDVSHAFKKINAPSLPYALSVFTALEGIGTKKIFLIKEIDTGFTAATDVVIYNTSENDKSVWHIFYMYDSKAYLKHGRDQANECNPEELQQYEIMLARLKRSVFDKGSVEIKERSDISFLPGVSIFETISSKRYSIEQMCAILALNLPSFTKTKYFHTPWEYVWVKEMEGLYDPDSANSIKIDSLTTSQPVVLKDVIIDGYTGDNYFTYNDQYYKNNKITESYTHIFESRKNAVNPDETSGLQLPVNIQQKRFERLVKYLPIV